MVQVTIKKIIGRGVNDKTSHILDNFNGVLKRRCTRFIVLDLIIEKEITCSQCLMKQDLDEIRSPLVATIRRMLKRGNTQYEIVKECRVYGGSDGGTYKIIKDIKKGLIC